MGFFEGKSNLYKVCIIGDGGTGKTSIVEQYLGNRFSVGYKLTIGTSISTHTTAINGREIKFQIWDLAGQQRFEFVRATFYRGSHAVVMVFDLTRPTTLENLREWKCETLRNIGKKPPFPAILLANKADLQHKALITQEMITNFRNELKIDFQFDVPFLFTSALSGMNIYEAFEILGLILVKNHRNIYRRDSPRIAVT
ncbi:MAG: Rab family GTPase [Candidatus Hodarchaeales archaeon]